MDALTTALKPLYGKLCELQITKDLRTNFEQGTWRVFVFDWESLSEEAQETLNEKIGQDDYHCFAIEVDDDSTSTDLEAMLEAEDKEILFFAPDRPMDGVYYGADGDMDTFTNEVDVLIRNLKAVS
jgi:hypothetical protein